MKKFDPQRTPARADTKQTDSIIRVLAVACLLIVVIAVMRCSRDGRQSSSSSVAIGSRSIRWAPAPASAPVFAPPARRQSPPETAAETVARKVQQFARDRRVIVREMAKHFGVDVTPEMERFFEAAEAGRWEEVELIYNDLRGQIRGQEAPPAWLALWPAISETRGVIDMARKFPAQQLLDYGNAILGALKPGMVYIGGTDEGRFIPTLLNETSGGERHVILTQNAFADRSYLSYAEFLYAGRVAPLTGDDSTRAFQEYLADAQRRLDHDEQLPDEPRQVRPGEDIRRVDNRVEVSGQVAVMSINEKLLQTLLDKNSNLSFALQESFSLASTYEQAVPLGPIFELRVRGDREALSRDTVAQTIEYWKGSASTLLSDAEAREDFHTRQSYSHLALAQANLFANRNYNTAAEEAYQIAMQLSPAYLEPVAQLARLYATSGRSGDALGLLANFAGNNPNHGMAIEELRGTLLQPR